MLYREFQVRFNSSPLGIRFEQRVDTPQYPYRLMISSIFASSEAALLLEPGNGLLRIGEVDVRYADLAHLSVVLRSTSFPVFITFAIPIEEPRTGLEKSFGGPNTNTVEDQLAVIHTLEGQPYPITTLPKNQPLLLTTPPIPLNPFMNQITNTDIVNVNDLKKSIFNIDARFRSNINSTSGTDFSFRLDSPIKNAIRLKLASFEFPYFYYVFSAKRGNTSFIIKDGNNNYPITIPDGSYDLNGSDTDLVNAINDAIIDLSSNEYFFYCTYSSLTGITTIGKYTTGSIPPTPARLHNSVFSLDFTQNIFSHRQADWGLGYYLGYRSKFYSGSNYYSGESVIDITGDPYLFLLINDYSNLEHKLDKGSILNAFAKFQLISSANTIIFIDSINLLYREIIFQNPQNITEFKIRICDSYGETVDLRQTNVSMAFEVTQVMNGELYDFYRNYLFQKNNAL